MFNEQFLRKTVTSHSVDDSPVFDLTHHRDERNSREIANFCEDCQGSCNTHESKTFCLTSEFYALLAKIMVHALQSLRTDIDTG